MSKSIFISGAAQGIGAAVAKRFLDKGWKVGAYDVVEVTYSHPNLRTGKLDVTDAEQWDAALADFAEFTGGQIDVVDNNAGNIVDGLLRDQDPKAIQKLIDVNCLGVTLGARAAYPYLKATPGSHLLSMSSASAIYGQPEVLVYSASKFYVKGFTEGLALEWRKDGIRVVDLLPSAGQDQACRRQRQIHPHSRRAHHPRRRGQGRRKGRHPPRNRGEADCTYYNVVAADGIAYFPRSVTPDRVAKLVMKYAV